MSKEAHHQDMLENRSDPQKLATSPSGRSTTIQGNPNAPYFSTIPADSAFIISVTDLRFCMASSNLGLDRMEGGSEVKKEGELKGVLTTKFSLYMISCSLSFGMEWRER